MKNVFRIISVVCILAMLSALFVSCNDNDKDKDKDKEPEVKFEDLAKNEQAVKLFELAAEKGDSADSYSTDVNMKIETYLSLSMNVKIVAESVGKIIVSGINKDDMFYLSDLTTTVKTVYSETDIEQTVQQITEGFADGKMFLTTRLDDTERKIYSEISKEDYVAFKEDENNSFALDFAITADTCKAFDCVKQEDGSWKATYKEFTESAMGIFGDVFKNVEDVIGDDYKITDYVLELTTSADFYPQSMTITPILEYTGDDENYEESKKPVISVSSEYKGFNETAPGEAFDVSAYKKVDDVRAISYISRAISDYLGSESGSFQLDVDTRITQGNKVGTYFEENEISFNNGKNFSFFTRSNLNGNACTVSYEKGYQTVVNSANGESSRTELEEKQAKAFFRGWVDPAGFSSKIYSSVIVEDELAGIYRVTIVNPDLTAVKSAVYSISSSVSFHSAEAIVTVTVRDGKLIRYDYELDATYKNTSGSNTIDVKLEYAIKYDK